MYIQKIVSDLKNYWSQHGCAVIPGYDYCVGAATFHPTVIVGALSNNNSSIVFEQQCRRPTDGRYGKHPNRMYKHHQLEVIIKPCPDNIIELYINSLDYIGLSPRENDIKFINNNWQSPILGATGLGWEIWSNGMEITQFTYFQQIGGIKCHPVSVELAYGIERLVMALQYTNDIYSTTYSNSMTYGDLMSMSEYECSQHSFHLASADYLFQSYQSSFAETKHLLDHKVFLPAYEECLRLSHIFNLLDARNLISEIERASMMLDVRSLFTGCCKLIVGNDISNNTLS